MKIIKLAFFAAGLMFMAALFEGCAVFVVGGVVAGGTYGTVSYVNNALVCSLL